MKKKLIRLLTTSFVGATLAACGGVGEVRSSSEENVGPYPENWRDIVVAWIVDNYADPRSITDSEAAPPFRNNRAFFDAWTVCIRNNAKNKFGGYTGRKIGELEIKKGKVVVADIDASNSMFCRNAKFEPLPLNFK